MDFTNRMYEISFTIIRWNLDGFFTRSFQFLSHIYRGQRRFVHYTCLIQVAKCVIHVYIAIVLWRSWRAPYLKKKTQYDVISSVTRRLYVIYEPNKSSNDCFQIFIPVSRTVNWDDTWNLCGDLVFCVLDQESEERKKLLTGISSRPSIDIHFCEVN